MIIALQKIIKNPLPQRLRHAGIEQTCDVSVTAVPKSRFMERTISDERKIGWSLKKNKGMMVVRMREEGLFEVVES